MNSPIRLWPLFAGPVVTLALGIGWTYDTFNTVKLLALGFVAAFATAEIILTAHKSPKFFYSRPGFVATLFLLSLLPAFVLSESPIAQQVYGAAGRNLGFLHYFFLTVIFLGFSTLNAKQIWPKILKSLVILGSFEAGYGCLQYFNLEFSLWENPEKWIFGTFGNPNYLSSFLSFSVIATVFLAITVKSWVKRILSFLTGFLQISVMFLSGSSQGLVLLTIGFFAIMLILLYQRSRVLGVTLLPLGLLGVVVATLGIFQYGPLGGLLYQDSVSYRGDYWRAGINMFRSNWIHGVGLDSYGDYYRMYRDARASNRRSLDVTSNSAHNLFIDLAATGGIFLLLGYLLILALVLHRIISSFRADAIITLEYKVLIILWVLFNLQTLISINVPALAVWGWIFSGVILAYGNEIAGANNLNRSKAWKKQTRSFLVRSVCCTVYLTLVSPLVSRDAALYDSLTKNDIREITQAVLSFPRDADQIAQVAIAFEGLDLGKESLDLAKEAIRENPNSSRAWQVIVKSSLANRVERDQAMKALTVLDPFYAATLK